MPIGDLEYYAKRAAEARRFADLALDSGTKGIHRQMAEEYEARVAALSARGIRGDKDRSARDPRIEAAAI